jgi:glycosyltransferase involved in cell wall biosynthesis
MQLKIRTNTMLGAKHSWALSVLNILKELNNLGHDLYIKSTDGYPNDAPELSKFFDRDIDNPDIDFCYTLPQNWNFRFKEKSKLKASIFNYETSIVPSEWASHLNHLDFVLPSSKFSMDIFINNGWDKDKLRLLPLGFDQSQFNGFSRYNIPSTRKFKFLSVSINHYRKNIDKLVYAYYNTFSDDDDVSLVLKTNLSNQKTKFECNVLEIVKNAQSGFTKKKLPNLILLDDKLSDMSGLYNSCDCFISASSSEGFGLPFLEAMASKKLIIAPRATGQLDFLNDNNCLFLDMNEVAANQNMQYWRAHPDAKTWMPKIDDISEKMLFAYKNKDHLVQKFSLNFDDVLSRYTWNETAKKLVNIYDNI